MPLFGRKKKRANGLSRPPSGAEFRSSSGQSDEQTMPSPDACVIITPAAKESSTLSSGDKAETDIYCSPRMHRSRSAGDACQLMSQLCYSSAPAALALSSLAIPELWHEKAGGEKDIRGGKPEADDNMHKSERAEKPHRTCKTAGTLAKVVEEDNCKLQAVVSRWEEVQVPGIQQRQRSKSLKKTDISERHGLRPAKETARTSGPDLGDSERGTSERIASGDRPPTSCEGAAKAKRKSVNLLTPSQMKVRRSNSEKTSPEESCPLKETLAPRRCTIPTCPRKSMPSLLLGQDPPPPSADETTFESPEQGHSEARKSGANGGSSLTSGCAVSNSLESVVFVPSDNSSPKTTGESIRVTDCSQELPANVSKSKNARFHKLFKSVPADEYPVDSFSCAFKGDILLQGMMYVSQNWLCFYSKIRARGRLLEIPLASVISITREKLALFIPNAIGIQVADQKFVFGSFMSRDNTYKLLLTRWKLSQDTANRPARSLCNGKGGGDDLTHSADISCESDTDTSEDAGEAEEMFESVLPGPAFLPPAELPAVHDRNLDQRGVARPSVLPSLRCIDCRKILTALSTFAVKVQKIPRTNLLLAICCILVLFLLLSAMGLTYKIVLLQTQLEMSNLWTPSQQRSFRDQVLGNIYTLQSKTHLATIHELHDILKANIQVLEQVHKSLKSLQGVSAWTPAQDCSTRK